MVDCATCLAERRGPDRGGSRRLVDPATRLVFPIDPAGADHHPV